MKLPKFRHYTFVLVINKSCPRPVRKRKPVTQVKQICLPRKIMLTEGKRKGKFSTYSFVKTLLTLLKRLFVALVVKIVTRVEGKAISIHFPRPKVCYPSKSKRNLSFPRSQMRYL